MRWSLGCVALAMGFMGIAAGMVWGGEAAGEGKAFLLPADVDWISNGGTGKPATAGRVVMRFDLRRVRGAHRAIRIAPNVADARIERTLAMRAVTRLDYSTLLEYTPDPLGDWASGRHDRLARAELASVGLRP